MKIFEFNPSEIEIDGKTMPTCFSGFVKVQIPTYKERIALIKQQGFAEKDGIDAGAELIEIVDKYVEEVELKHDATGTIYECVEDLGYSREGAALINEIGKTILQGMPLGNG